MSSEELIELRTAELHAEREKLKQAEMERRAVDAAYLVLMRVNDGLHAEIDALRAQNERLREALCKINRGDYDNAHSPDAARKVACEALAANPAPKEGQ